MSDTVILAENLTKVYRIGRRQDSYRTFRDVLASKLLSPFKRLSTSQPGENGNDETELIYALKDVSFEVKRGEVTGVIGRNGAGKSTLLKILSKITEPTSGYAEIHGVLGSLLEVGTGFHPELTGRENIYLNGAILGMKKSQIEKKFDEIVAFAELEKFLDTAVKHYSSGMYIRLAFAVAAHLEPEVLLIDEVLSVGDLAFQKKCLGKMGNVAKEGRTILFVSHQMDAVRALCKSSILLSEGKILSFGETGKVVDTYVESISQSRMDTNFEVPENEKHAIQIIKGRILDKNGRMKNQFDVHEPIFLEYEYAVRKATPGLVLSFQLSKDGVPILLSFDTDHAPELLENRKAGRYISRIAIPCPLLKPGRYFISTNCGVANLVSFERLEDILCFDVELHSRPSQFLSYAARRPGVIAIPLEWEIHKVNGNTDADGEA